MPGVRRFADLECHKLAVQVRREVLRLTRRDIMRREFKYLNQIRDAARSAPRNIAEGFSRFNPSETVPYVNTSKASLDEVRDQIIDAFESRYITEAECDAVLEVVSRAIGALMRWMQYLESPGARRFYEEHKARRRQRDYTPRAALPNPNPNPNPNSNSNPERKEP